VKTRDALIQTLRRIDRGSYGLYKQIKGLYDFDGKFQLGIAYVQGDAYARPSRVFVRVPLTTTGIPQELLSNKVRCVAVADFLSRRVCDLIRSDGIDRRASGGGWSGGKGGELRMEVPGQAVLERTSVQVLASKGYAEARFEVGLPASGRSIEGQWAIQILTGSVPQLVEMGLLWRNLDQANLTAHVHAVEDQESLRAQLMDRNLVAFIADGSILPRLHGQSDKPMAAGATVSFSSPDTLRVSFNLPNRAAPVEGMGIPAGVTLLVGGGFHGKSTLLQAVQLGVYNHIIGDGRELVSCNADAVKIRAEDGRPINKLNISSFINNLPFGRSTSDFSTGDASGSTSQAANIAEALEMGAKVLILDEDTCATNFMYRDDRMASLVHPDKEPITPFLDRVRQLYSEKGISSILVVGSCGAYFDVADTVISLDCYKVNDVTAAAHATQPLTPIPRAVVSQEQVFPDQSRKLTCSSLCPVKSGKVSVQGIKKIFYGDEEIHINLGGLEQMVEVAQVNAIADAMQSLSSLSQQNMGLVEILDSLEQRIDAEGLDALGLTHRENFGGYSRPRRFELAASINRWRNTLYS